MSFTTTTITLGRQTFTVAELSFGRLKRVLPAVSRVMPKLENPDFLDTETLDAMLLVVQQAIEAAGGSQTIAELEELPIRPAELVKAISAVVQLIHGAQAGEESGSPN